MITFVSPSSSSVFDLLRAELDAPYDCGSWFLVENDKIVLNKNGKAFSSNIGLHPVVIKTKYNPGRHGPNVSGYARSSTRPGDFTHSAHSLHDGQSVCAINKDGWVKLSIPVSVTSSEISAASYSCHEDEDSLLMSSIRNAK